MPSDPMIAAREILDSRVFSYLKKTRTPWTEMVRKYVKLPAAIGKEVEESRDPEDSRNKFIGQSLQRLRKSGKIFYNDNEWRIT